MDKRIFSMRRGWLAGILGLILCLALVFSVVGDAATGSASADDEGRTYPVMRPDRETLDEWLESYYSAPIAYIEREGFQIPSPRGSQDLLSHLDYDAATRNQGGCNNCWAWAGTGCLGIALDVQEGIWNRLSVQYINSCEKGVIGKTCCTDGYLYEFADYYAITKQCIPWSNTNAYWQDGDASCDTDCLSISTDPNYPITSIDDEVVPTLPPHGVTDQATAIANIKNVLNHHKAVWFGFFLPTWDSWHGTNGFYTFWNSADESVAYDMD